MSPFGPFAGPYNFVHDEIVFEGDSEGIEEQKRYYHYQMWIQANAGYKLFWDSWQRRLVEVPNRTDVWDKAKMQDIGLYVVNVHTGEGYTARYDDLRGVTPLEALAHCAD